MIFVCVVCLCVLYVVCVVFVHSVCMCCMYVRRVNHTCYFKGSRDADTSEHEIVELWGDRCAGTLAKLHKGPSR